MNILYLHGFGSSGQSNTVEYLKKSLPDYYDITAPDIPVDPALAETFLAEKHPAAYYLKGYLYEYGLCYIKENMTRARHWYGKAAEAGDEVAAWKLKQLE